MHKHSLYGLTVSASEPLPAPAADAAEEPDIIVRIANARWSITPENDHKPDVYYQREANGDVLVRWYDRLDFRVSADGRSILGYPRAGTPHEALFSYLLSQAISIALLQRGIEGLHATAFERDGTATALLGACGFGKSTLTAHALRRGARLLTDDLLICSGGGLVQPGAARIKLDRALALQMLGNRNGTPMYDAPGKWIFPLSVEEFAAKPVPLRAIYVLAPGAATARSETLGEQAAFQELVRATFNPLETNAARLASHMRYHAALIREVPVFRLHVPRDLRQLDDVLALMN